MIFKKQDFDQKFNGDENSSRLFRVGKRILFTLVWMFVVGGLLSAALALFLYFRFAYDLPDYSQLKEYKPQVVTRLHAADGRMIAEFATEKRVFVPIGAIPERVKDAFLAAEDGHFYTHPGVNLFSIFRAIPQNVRNVMSGRRPVGASTITQQVAKNFLLMDDVKREKSDRSAAYERKIKEMVLALRIEKALTKDQILELYLNEIYLGYESYGVAAAALNYFDKSLDLLTADEAAYLAALPKGPNNYHPVKRYEQAVARRNWILARMEEHGFITKKEMQEAQARPLKVIPPKDASRASAPYVAEQVRRELLSLYGADVLYGGGLSVRTTVEPTYQVVANRVLQEGLEVYDRRHGYRGPIAHLNNLGDWSSALDHVAKTHFHGRFSLAVVESVAPASAGILVQGVGKATLGFGQMQWARKAMKDSHVGTELRVVSDALRVGDVILVEKLPEGYALRQIPTVGGAIVVMDPHTGRVLAMDGGYDAALSEFNRAVQAKRQPGSAFKPFVYLAAMDHGFTPSSIVLDAPVVVDQGPGLAKWRPANYSRIFYGPSPVRLGLEQSRNLMTIRLAQAIGMDVVLEYARKFGVYDESVSPMLSMALGAGETTLLKMTTAYAMLVNGGKRITPSLIDRVQDMKGSTIYRRDGRICAECLVPFDPTLAVPVLNDKREQVADARSIYQVVSMMQGVVQRGTAASVGKLGRPLAGKTGTTNDSQDAWFIGFSPDLVVGVWVGFDTPQTLGYKETGGRVSAPIFKAFMAEVLKNQPVVPFRVPSGLRFMRVDLKTGRLAGPETEDVILEAFKPGTEPSADDAGPSEGADPGASSDFGIY